MSFFYRGCVPPYAISPDYGSDKPFYLYIPSPILTVLFQLGVCPHEGGHVAIFQTVDNNGFMRESIKHRGAMILDLSQATGSGPNWEQKWINYVNVINSIKPWRTAGKPFVCDRLWLWTS